MTNLFYYLVQVIIVSGILYGYYHFFLRNNKFHRYNRFYLLAATLLSITVPFLNIPVYFSSAEKESSLFLQTLSVISSTGFESSTEPVIQESSSGNWFTWQNLSWCFYLLIAAAALLKVIFSLLKIRRIMKQYTVKPVDRILFVNTDEPGTPFSFFRWLFWNRKIELRSGKGQQIFRHELFHIEQKHSWDILFTEMLTVIFWINPFFHLLKKELKAIHEFLADRFAVTENNKWEYAELLLMQTLNTSQRLVHPFFNNQIKRRIAMITTSSNPGYQYGRKLMVLPLAAILLAFFAFSYKTQKINSSFSGVSTPITVVIDAGHGGSDPGARGSDGTLEKDIVLAIAQKIKQINEDENIRIILTRETDELPGVKERSEFSNKQKPDLFLSLHVNTSPSSHKTGFEVYIPNKNKNYYSENKILGTILMNYCSLFYPADKTIKQRDPGIWILDNSNCPSALVELGYISNKNDLAFMKDPAGQEKIAKAVLQTIDQYVMQSKSSDWNERKQVFIDTVKPELTITKNPSSNKSVAHYNGRLLKEIYEYESSDQLVFVFENNDMMLLSKEISRELMKKYGANLSSLITKKPKLDSSDEDNKVFDKVETEASFPGGDAKWKEWLKNTLNHTISANPRITDGAYTVVIQFIVDKEGKISDLKALTKHGHGMEAEALRVIKNGPKWNPAMQNGRIVRSYKKLPITFVVGKGEKNFPGTSKINTPETASNPDVQARKDNIVFAQVENEPFFPGGSEKWRQYLQKYINAGEPVEKGAAPGLYTVIVQFIVDTAGWIRDIQALTKFGYGMEEQVMTLIKNGPRWQPAIQNGRKVTAYKKQPVTFQIVKENVKQGNISKTPAFIYPVKE